MLLRLVPEKTDIKFLAMRKVGLSFSGLLIIASIVLFFVDGLNYGIDFKGGVNLYMQTSDGSNADVPRIRRISGNNVIGEVKVKEFGEKTDIVIAIEEQPGDAHAQNLALKTVQEAIIAEIPTMKFLSSEVIGPQVSGELKQDGILAISFAIFAVLIYIWFRFEWQFGLGAVIALMHDLLLTIGFFAVTGLEFNLSIIAALLTIVGYSLNDTVVVYDRVRENVRKFRKMTMEDVLDLSLNQTLSRTMMTSVTTLVALLSLFFLGGEVIRGFTAAMIWGVVVGTYSSVFVASPMLLTFKLHRDALLMEDSKRDPTVDKSKLTPLDHL
jgi:preprotein translocase subunit SecF